jgi:hypothetical protein
MQGTKTKLTKVGELSISFVEGRFEAQGLVVKLVKEENLNSQRRMTAREDDAFADHLEANALPALGTKLEQVVL